jgi:hypothetical protein
MPAKGTKKGVFGLRFPSAKLTISKVYSGFSFRPQARAPLAADAGGLFQRSGLSSLPAREAQALRFDAIRASYPLFPEKSIFFSIF